MGVKADIKSFALATTNGNASVATRIRRRGRCPYGYADPASAVVRVFFRCVVAVVATHRHCRCNCDFGDRNRRRLAPARIASDAWCHLPRLCSGRRALVLHVGDRASRGLVANPRNGVVCGRADFASTSRQAAFGRARYLAPRSYGVVGVESGR